MRLQELLSNIGRKQKIFIALFVSVVVVLAIFGFATRYNHSKQQGKKFTIIDKNSGESVNTIVGENETFSASEVRPYLLGTDTLVKIGMSSFQIETLKDSLYKYSKTNTLNLKKASISVKDLLIDATGFRTENQTTFITAPLVLDDTTTLFMTLTYRTSDEITIGFLKSKGGESVYNSGLVTQVPSLGEEDD